MPAEPRWATPRTPSRPSFGPAVARLAEALGKPLQPWQRQVVDVALELIEDSAGPILYDGRRWSWAYRTVVVHVQRQAGKTTLIGPVNLHTLLTRPRAKTWLTAQSRQDGRDAWKDVAELVASSPLREILSVRRSNGSEELAAPATGSTFRVFAPSEDALHGKANERVTVDESWAFDGAQGHALQQAILPTFTTTGGQLWLPSTAGTAASTWLLGYVERGRAAVESGQTRGIAYFEWSLAPDAAATVSEILSELARTGGPTSDELHAELDRAVELTLAAHPGTFVRADAVREAALEMPPGEFLRAYGNVWTLTADRVIPDHLWRQQLDPELAPPQRGAVQLGYDVALDRSSAAIGAGWEVSPGITAIDAIDARPGSSWLVERIEQLAERYGVTEVWYDRAGPALDIADELTRRGKVTPVPIGMRDYTASCSAVLAGIMSGRIVHRGTPALDEAAAAAARRELGDGWAWSRRQSAGAIASLVAATVAHWGVSHKPAPAPAPVVSGGRRERVDELVSAGARPRRPIRNV